MCACARARKISFDYCQCQKTNLNGNFRLLTLFCSHFVSHSLVRNSIICYVCRKIDEMHGKFIRFIKIHMSWKKMCVPCAYVTYTHHIIHRIAISPHLFSSSQSPSPFSFIQADTSIYSKCFNVIVFRWHNTNNFFLIFKNI